MAVIRSLLDWSTWRIGLSISMTSLRTSDRRRPATVTTRHLAEAGFILLHDRKVPGYGGNLDHVAIGPTGVWAIETKNVAGKVEIDGDSLRIRGYRQDRMVDQVYREATAVQVNGGERVSLEILSLAVIQGHIQRRALGMVVEWARGHQRELEDDWERARRGQPLLEIRPLE